MRQISISKLHRALRWTASFLLLLAVLLPLCAQGAERDFAIRYTKNTNGDIYLIGNTGMTCSPTGTNAASCTPPAFTSQNDDYFTMVYANGSGTSTSTQATSATLSMPAGSSVLWAGLYWQGDSSAAARGTVTLQGPSTTSSVAASQLDTIPGQGCGGNCTADRYSAFADVTNLVQVGGNGTYTVSNIQGTPSNANTFAGWGLIVVFQNDSLPFRNLTVFDGYKGVTTTANNNPTPNPNIAIPVSGFLTPYSGPVNTVMGVIAGEGDMGITGDSVNLNGTTLSDAAHPSNNFFTSVISNLGATVSSKSPNYTNQLGWDIARINASNILANGATSATINLSTTQDWFYPSAVTFMTDIYVPIITPNVNKSAADVNGGYLLPGDTLRFTISLGNTGYDTATNVILTDNIPAWTTYVPGSLRVLTGANPGAKSDASGDDQAEYISSGTPRVVFRLGQGANATSGGTLPLNAFTSISFDVTVNANIPASTAITNTALISNNGQTIASTSYSSASNPVQVVVLTPPTVTKSFSPNPIDIGGVSTMTLQLSNPAGNAAAVLGVNFTDNYPPGMINDANPSPTVSCTAGSAPGSLIGGAAGSASIGINGATLAQNGSCTITVRVKSTSNQQGNYTNTTGFVYTGNAGTSPGASATLSVGGPAIATAISPAVLVSGSSTSAVTFTLSNPTVVPLTAAAFTSALPAGVQVAAGAVSNSCGGTLTAAAGGSSITLAGGTIPAAAGSPGSCSVTVPVTAASGYYSVSAGGVTTSQTPIGAPSNAATLTALTPLTVSKSFFPASIKAGADVSQVSITVGNPNGTAAANNASAPAAATTVSSVSFTDSYPAPYIVNTNVPNAAVSCTAGSSATVAGGAAGGGNAGITGGVLAPGGSCTLTVNVTSGTAGNYTNHTGPVSFTTSSGTAVQAPEATAGLNVSALAPPAVAVSFTPSAMPVSQSSTLKIVLTNSNTAAITGVSFSDLYPGGVVNTGTPALANSCGGTVTTAAGGSSLVLSGGSIPGAIGGVPGSCTITVQVQASASGSYYDTIPQVTTANAGVGAQAGATLYVLDPPLISKAFSPNSIRTGTTYYSTLNITVSNPSTNTASLTSVSFADNYPSGLLNSATATSSVTCSTGSSATLTGGANNGTSVGMSGGTILPGGNCVVSVRVTSATANNYVNTTSAVSSSNGGPGSTASDILAVGNISISKAFAASAIPLGGSTTMTVTMTNGSETAIADAAFTDTLPAGMSVTGFTAAQCGGTVTYNAATRVLGFSGGDVARRGGTCAVQATVTATSTATNTIPAGAFTGGGRSNADPASATLTVYTPPAVSASFSPQTVFAGSQSPSVLTIMLSNANDIAATGVSFTDNYPAGLINTASPGIVNSCGGTVTATANGTSLALTGGTINAGESCSVTVNVMSNSAGSYADSTGTITTANIGNQTTPATATLQVLQPLSVAMAFSPSTIGTGAASLVTVTLTNPNAGTNIVGASFTDSLPSGLTIAAAPGGSTTCVGGSVSAVGGDGSFSFSGATVPAGSSCTVSVNVTGASAGSYANSTGPVTTSNAGIANGASATLTVSMPAPAVSIGFSPGQIGINGTSTLTVTISNPNATAITNAAFTDSYPAGLLNAGSASFTCSTGVPTGSATTPDGSTLKLTGATIPANGSCTVSVTVTSATANGYSNTISAVTSQNAGTGGPASAPLLVLLNAPQAAASFSPATIGVNASSVLTITLTNPNSGAISGAGFTDLYPGGLVNTATPNASISPAGCGGTLTAGAGGSSLSLANATIPANSNCTVTVNVTSAAAASYTNSSGTISSSNALPGAAASAQLAVSGTTLKKYFDGLASSNVVAGQPSTLKLTVSNGAGNPAQPAFSFTDTLPATLAISGTPASSCGGTVTTGTSGGRSFLTLVNGTLALNATGCEITATVTGSTTGSYRNYYDANPALSTLSALSGGVNAAGADATLTIAAAPTLSTGAFTPPTIVTGQSSTITFTIHNNASGSPTLNGLSYTEKLPANLTFTGTPVVVNCGGGAATYNAAFDTLTFSNGSVGSSDCTVSATVTSSTANPYSNGSANITSIGGGLLNGVTSQSLTVIVPATLNKSFTPSTMDAFQSSTLAFTIGNPAGNPAQSGLGFTDTLPGGGALVLAAAPAFSTTCGGALYKAGTTTPVTGGESAFTFSGGSIGGGASATSCSVSVAVTSSVPGSYLNDTGRISSLTGGLAPVPGMSASLTVQVPNPALSKSFTASPILTGQVSTLKFTINNGQGNLAQSGLGFTDTFPAGLVVANPPNVTFTPAASCVGSVYRGGTTTALAAGDGSLTLAGATMANGTPKCEISVDVTSATASPGAGYLNSAANGNVTAATGELDVAAAAAILVVNNRATLTKAFAAPVIAAGTSTTLTFTITNGTGSPAQSGLSFTDTFSSANLVVTAASSLCGGTVSFTANSITLANGALAAGPPGPPNSCTVKATVTSTVPGSYGNGPAQIGGLGGGLVNGVTGQTLVVAADPTLSVGSFSPAVIGINQPSTLVFRIHNADPAQPTVTGIGFTDKLPANLAFSGSPSPSAGCGTAFTAGYNAAFDTLTFTGGEVAAADCTITTTVIGAVAGGPYTNNAASVTSVSGGLSNQLGAGSGLTVAAPTLGKQFAAATMGPNTNTSVSFTITNGSGNPAQSGFGFSETLPAGLTFVAGSQSSNCGGTAAIAGSNVLNFTGGALNAGTPNSCTVSATVTGSTLGSYVNAPARVAVSGGLINGIDPAAPPTLKVVGTSLAKSFLPSTITAGLKSTLRFTITNDASNPAQSGLAFTDNFPGSVVVAAPVTVTNSCGGGLYKSGGTTPLSGGESAVSFSGGSFAGGAAPGSCTVTVEVTSASTGGVNNSANITVPAGSPIDASGASDTLTVNAAPKLDVTFNPNPIVSGGTSTLKFSIANGQGLPAQSGVAFTNQLPGSLVVANPPNISITGSGCSGGAVYKGGTTSALAAGDGSLTFTGLSMAAGTANCFVSVDVTSSLAGSYTDDSGRFSSLGGGLVFQTGATLAVVTSSPTLSKTFGPSTIAVGATSTLTFTINNAYVSSDYPAQSGLGFTDTLPANVVIAGAPVTPQCGGTVSGAVGSSVITFSGGALGVHVPSCRIDVPVKSSVASSGTGYRNYYDGSPGAGKVTGLAGGLTAPTADASLVVSGTALSESFAQSSAGLNQPVKLSFAITNGTNQPNQTALGFTDTLPAGLSLSGVPTTPQCGGGTVAYSVDGSGRSVVTFSGGSLASGAAGCTVDVMVFGAGAGSYTNDASSVSGLSAGMTFSGSATLTLLNPPTVGVAFGTSPIGSGGVSRMTITLTNGNSTDITGVAFSDLFPNAPGQLSVAATPNLNNGCGGSAATPGSNSVVVSGAVVPHNSSCTVSVDVSATVGGAYTNNTGAVSTANAGSGASASAVLNVSAPSLSKAFGASSLVAGKSTTLTFTVANGPGNPAQKGLAFTDTMPANVTVTGAASSQCGGTVSFTANSLSLSGGLLPAGPPGSCQVVATVTSAVAGTWTNGGPNIGGLGGGLVNNVTDQSLEVYLLPAITSTKAADRTTGNPGDIVTFNSVVTNAGSGPATNVIVTGYLSPYTAFALNSYGAGVPFAFAEGTPPSALSLGTYSFSSDKGVTWGYLPVSGGGGAPAGYDGNITNWQIFMNGTMNPAGANFSLSYKAVIK